MFTPGMLVEALGDGLWFLDSCDPSSGPCKGEICRIRHTGINSERRAVVWLEEWPGDTEKEAFYIYEIDGELNFRPLSESRLAILRSLLQPIPSPEKERV